MAAASPSGVGSEEARTMARYTGPKVKLSRRLGVNVFENDKGSKALERRPYPPGEHGRARRRQPSEYLLQLQEKQKAKYIYGVLERQFSNLYKEASRQKGVTGENLLRMLELRLDNIVFRAGWASTRPQARQFVNHGLLNVNGKRVDIPSYRVRKGDVVELRDKSRGMIVIRHNLDTLARITPSWLEKGDDGLKVTVAELPARDAIDVPVREQLIVELYSR
jgi:small subunit ribosomal protein S4